MMYYVSNELSHHGVKGMRWGIRKQRVSSGIRRSSSNSNSSSGRKKMSTAKKVAIGAACVAAVAGVSYLAVKTHQTSVYNKAAKAAVKKALYAESSRRPNHATTELYQLRKSGVAKRGFPIRPNKGMYMAADGHWYKNSGKTYSESYAKLTGHSGRVTKAGAARHRNEFYSKRALDTPITSDYMTNYLNDRRILERKAKKAMDETLGYYDRSHVVKFNNYGEINKLKRKKKVFG